MGNFKFFKAHPYAKAPRRADPGAAGYDLSSVDEIIIRGKSQVIVDTGIVIECPSDCYARVAPRSGLAAKNSIDVLAGVVDSSYRNTIKVILYNHSDMPFMINIGDRIAQLIFERIYTPEFEEVFDSNHLSTTIRDQNGFGSTGVAQ